ncbi:MAG: nuclear transport factor 2 family protein [Caulobacteraceae bacterium]
MIRLRNALLMAAVLAAAALPAAAATDRLAAAEAKARAVSTELQRLEDQRQIERLQMVYGFYFDKKLWDEVAALFAPSGTMEMDNRGVFVGPAHIRRSLEVFGPQPIKTGQLFNYIQLQPIVTVAPGGRTAKARWRAFIQTGVSGQAGEWADGVYENDYVNEGGVWKIKRLRYCQTMRTAYAQGWAKSAEPAAGVDPNFKPDRPSTGECRSYPDIQGPAFHFKNPAAG